MDVDGWTPPHILIEQLGGWLSEQVDNALLGQNEYIHASTFLGKLLGSLPTLRIYLY